MWLKKTGDKLIKLEEKIYGFTDTISIHKSLGVSNEEILVNIGKETIEVIYEESRFDLYTKVETFPLSDI